MRLWPARISHPGTRCTNCCTCANVDGSAAYDEIGAIVRRVLARKRCSTPEHEHVQFGVSPGHLCLLHPTHVYHCPRPGEPSGASDRDVLCGSIRGFLLHSGDYHRLRRFVRLRPEKGNRLEVNRAKEVHLLRRRSTPTLKLSPLPTPRRYGQSIASRSCSCGRFQAQIR